MTSAASNLGPLLDYVREVEPRALALQLTLFDATIIESIHPVELLVHFHPKCHTSPLQSDPTAHLKVCLTSIPDYASGIVASQCKLV